MFNTFLLPEVIHVSFPGLKCFDFGFALRRCQHFKLVISSLFSCDDPHGYTMTFYTSFSGFFAYHSRRRSVGPGRWSSRWSNRGPCVGMSCWLLHSSNPYLGYFTRQYRLELLYHTWIPFLHSLKARMCYLLFTHLADIFIQSD